ncbi:MAG: M3 family metallopeptidase, partial [Bacteroidia bacterium]
MNVLKPFLSCLLFAAPFFQLPAQEVHPCSGNPLEPHYNETMDFSRVTVNTIQEATLSCQNQVKVLNGLITGIKDADRNFANTLALIDKGMDLIDKSVSTYELISSTSPSKEIRDAASTAYQTLTGLASAQSLNEDLYKAVTAYALTKDAEALHGERKFFLDKLLRDYRREGFALSKIQRDTLKVLNDKLTDLSVQFRNNIAQDNPFLTMTSAEMEGLPDDYIQAHKQADGTYKLDASNPSYLPFMTYAKSTEARKKYYLLKMNVAAPANDILLADIIRIRTRKAKLLGYQTYAEYATDPNMSKNKKNVWAFENTLKTDLRAKAEQEYKEMLALKNKDSYKPSTILYPYENAYYTNMLLETKYKVDEEKVKEYFELQNVIQGLFGVYQKIYNLSFVEDKHPSVWTPDVQAFQVTDNVTKKIIGYFYLDLYPRDNKYKHAACFPITNARNCPEGRQLASASLVCNFPKP